MLWFSACFQVNGEGSIGQFSEFEREYERLLKERLIQGRCIEAPTHTQIYAVSTHFFEATVTCRIKGRNIVVYPGNFVKGHLSNDLRFPIATVYPKNSKYPSDWDYEIGGHLGVAGGRPDKKHIYRLPFETNKTYMVLGKPGKGRHIGPMKYAIDFDMPEGAIICAARDGVVVGYRDNSSLCGSDPKIEPFANFVTIKHRDGSYGDYCHLKKNGVLVKLGATVRAGQPIALAGSTGQCCRPHLHFNVFYFSSDTDIGTSVPVLFSTNLGVYRTPLIGDYLKVPGIVKK